MPTTTDIKTEFTDILHSHRRAGASLCENGYPLSGRAGATFNGDKLNARSHLAQFAAARDWLKAAQWKKRGHSYELKHRAEASTGIYISNGALIAAAESLGLKLKREEDNGPNAWIWRAKQKR